MHTSSMEHVQRLVEKYLTPDEPLHAVDVGSYDVNGSYRQFFDIPGWRYTGVDLAAGPNVDVVLRSPYRLPFQSFSVDVVVSGQAFEHVEFFWLTWMEMARVVRPGGYIFLLAPSRGPEHRYPQDCWRFYPDGYRALSKYVSMELLEVSTDWEPHPSPDSGPWGDTVGVFKQRSLSRFDRWRRVCAQRVRYLTIPGFI